MKNVRVHLKTDSALIWKHGLVLNGALWEWRPAQGWFSIVDNEGGPPIQIPLEDCISAIEENVMTRYNHIEDVDLVKSWMEERDGSHQRNKND